MNDVVVLAHHSVLLAIPAFAPAFVVVGVVIYIAMRDRKKGDEPHGESSGPARKDGAP
ncbi:hypothetical protein [Mycolicibacterium moriokaense]|jgi:hypothetical protein|uniref:Uncharacterized protein n=1 Tax=Mycolicibacterium moriokaense TaxID=39691 RepID=A0AAD1H727_9MYCO|nr:hypothetical protein [Mycolicibacterium moriokaense]MCV7039551.1 hypothetical protein [Mycolicibacterium moriokaense]BBW99741.1 hypothetical protein MMOR_06780 [Mycolicibacterium moriokaense]